MTATALFAHRDDAQLVEAARGDQPQAYGELFERWYDRCYDVAWGVLRHRETAADVAQEAFCACWERLPELRDPAAFGGWILRATRNHALNRLERDRIRRHDPIDAEEPMAIPDPAPGPDAQLEQNESRRLVWTAAAVLGDRDTSLLDLHLRHGLGPSEIADELSITPNNASQLLHRLRVQLRETIGAVLLWRAGRPACGALARLLGPRRDFDAELSAVIRRHRRACIDCSAEVLQRQPELLFASIPLALASVALKDQARSALAQAGVPMLAPAAPVQALAALPPSDGGATIGSAAVSGATGSLPLAGKALLPALVGAVAVAGVLGLLGSGIVTGGSGPGSAPDAAVRPVAAGPAPAPVVGDPTSSPAPEVVALVAQRGGTSAGVAGAIGSSGARVTGRAAPSPRPSPPPANGPANGPGPGAKADTGPAPGAGNGTGTGNQGGSTVPAGSGSGGGGQDAGGGRGYGCPPGWVAVRVVRLDHGRWVSSFGCYPLRPWWPGPHRR